jgi:filamentous hemagglutinin
VKSGGTIELFTDSRGPQVPGAVGVGPKDAAAIAADARNMPNIPSNSQAMVVANNPFIPKEAGGTGSVMDFLPEAQRITQPGGKVVLNMNGANPNFKSMPTESQLQQMGFKIEYQGPLLPEYQTLTLQRLDGSPIPNATMKTIVLVKK